MRKGTFRCENYKFFGVVFKYCDIFGVQKQRLTLKFDSFYIAGHTLLHSPVVVEKLGSRQNPSANDGFGPWHHIRGRKAIEKETLVGLPLRKLEKPQLLSIQILFL